MQGFHMQICSLIIPWQMEYVEVYSLHISVILFNCVVVPCVLYMPSAQGQWHTVTITEKSSLFNCPSVPHGQSFYNKLVLETYNEDPLMVSMVADKKVLSVNQHNPILWM